MRAGTIIAVATMLSVYLVTLIQPVIPWVEYLLQREYIAVTFCENMDRPELQCGGKCYVIKQVKKMPPHNNAHAVQLVMLEYIPMSTSTPHTQQAPPVTSGDVPDAANALPLMTGYLKDIFRPPECA